MNNPSERLAQEQDWPDERALLGDWHAFIQTREASPRVRLVIARSWKRCLLRLNPNAQVESSFLSSEFLRAFHEASLVITSIGRRVLEDVYEYIENSRTALFLINNTGYIVDQVGDRDMLAAAADCHLLPGVLAAEAQIGTHAFSLAVTEGIPVRVRGAEHFLKQFHHLASAAAPIFDLNGRSIGALGLLNYFEDHTPHTLGLAVAGALTITSQRQSDLLLAEQNSQVNQLNAILSTISDGVLVWDASGKLIHLNEPAEQLINQAAKTVLGRHFSELFSLPPPLEEALQNRETLANTSVRVRFGGRPLDVLLSVRYVYNRKDLAWVVVSMRKEADIFQLAQGPHSLRGPGISETVIGVSAPARRLRSITKSAAAARASVMIRGERGTGKNTLASAIHNDSSRHNEPFVYFPCASINPTLMLEEMLGVSEDISPSNPWGKQSKFEMAQGGTLYFQDVEALTLECQRHLLDVLEMGIQLRLGSRRPLPVDVRVIGSSSADLDELVQDGKFLHGLYYRMSAFELRLPSLRERLEDLPLLAEEIMKRLYRQFNEPLRLSEEALQVLLRYSWPGNLRELEAVLRLAASQLHGAELILPSHLPDFILMDGTQSPGEVAPAGVQPLADIEREALIRAVRQMHGNVTHMARLLGISRTTLWRKLRTYEISVEDFRTPQ